MIEINWVSENINVNDVLTNITQLVTWLMVTMKTMKEQKKAIMNGFLIITEQNKGTSALLLTDDDEIEQQILNVLLSPPPEFKNKFNTSILQTSPLTEEKEKATDESTTT